MSVSVIKVSATDLAKGMRVYRRDRFGNLKPDFSVGEAFTTSGPDRLQPIAFHTDNGVKVFSLCSTVEVGTGREEKAQRNSKGANRKTRKAGVR